ncbi:MAG: flagellar basal body rod protein FlgC [Robiginitomaculum sp.]|nr:MAG: flagellar basal body rod protein FlgC [Robiginitomaculum sp.]
MANDPFSSAMASASQGMNVQAFRLRIVSENLSNTDTHGFRRKMVSFQNEYDARTASDRLVVGNVTLDQSPGERLYDPGHPLSDQQGYVLMSNVDMMIELADAREAGRSYEANLTTFQQARKMYSGLLDLIRR